MSNHFEKPKDWGVAPQSNWVSGTPIGQSEVKMPTLGDPGSHENASAQMSFSDDDMKAESTWRIAPGGRRIQPGEPCPEGTETKGASCAPSENAPATMGQRRVSQQFKREEKESAGRPEKKREVPEAKGGIRKGVPVERLRKMGVKARTESNG